MKILPPRCPRSPGLMRAPRPEADPDLSRHLEHCATCWAERTMTRRLADLGRALPWAALDQDQAASARARLIRVAVGQGVTAPRRLLWLRLAVPILFSLGAATVLGAVGARLFRPALFGREPVPLPPSTSVERARPGSQLLLPAPTPPSTAKPAPTSTPAGSSPARPAKPVGPTRPRRIRAHIAGTALPARPAAAPPVIHQLGLGPGEQAFVEGWRAMRAGDHVGAARAMARTIEASPNAALAEDARYWRAVALARAGHAPAARTAMEEFLRLYPQSSRSGEISAILGWLLIDAGEDAAAEIRFRAAELDLRPAVRASARAGLTALGVH